MYQDRQGLRATKLLKTSGHLCVLFNLKVHNENVLKGGLTASSFPASAPFQAAFPSVVPMTCNLDYRVPEGPENTSESHSVLNAFSTTPKSSPRNETGCSTGFQHTTANRSHRLSIDNP